MHILRNFKPRYGFVLVGFLFVVYLYTIASSAHWLGKNMYYEARGEGVLGWVAVANVTFNRMDDGRWPNTVEGVVTDGTERGIHCDFSWYCDGKPDTPKFLSNKFKLQGFYVLAFVLILLEDLRVLPDLTHGAHSYQRVDLQDEEGWFGTLQKTVVINNHKFYRDRKNASL